MECWHGFGADGERAIARELAEGFAEEMVKGLTGAMLYVKGFVSKQDVRGQKAGLVDSWHAGFVVVA